MEFCPFFEMYSSQVCYVMLLLNLDIDFLYTVGNFTIDHDMEIQVLLSLNTAISCLISFVVVFVIILAVCI